MKKIMTMILLMTALSLLNIIMPVSAADKETISEYVDEFRRETKCGDVSVAVVSDEGDEFYGDETGLYQIGSMTKAFTGMAALKLINEGVINEDDSLSELLPGFTAFYEAKPVEITVGQLLAQTSGYTNKEKDYPSAAEDMSLNEWVESISGKALSSRPGEKYAYSNVNYDLLGAVIEGVSGKPYSEYMYEEILLPLGLTNTYVGMPDKEKNRILGSRLGYRRSFEYEIPVYEGRIPAGYFYSNTKDMARWIKIWTGRADIPEEYRELTDLVKKHLNEQGDYYGGWELFENDVTGHSGGTPNYSSRIVFSKKEKAGVCVLTNMNVAASTDGLCNGIYSIATGGGAGRLPMDVWTIFDVIFSAISAFGILMIIITLITKKRGVIIGNGITALIIFLTISIVMPLVFGAGLTEILFIWAPCSFAGGLLILAATVPVAVVRAIKTDNKN